MATRLEILLDTVFEGTGIETAIARVREMGSELKSSLGGADTDIPVDLSIDNSPIVATREEITELSNLAPVVSLMTDFSEGVATEEEIRAWNNIDPIITPMVDDSNIIATQAEISQLANLSPVIRPEIDRSAGIATINEIAAYASSAPTVIRAMVDDSQPIATLQEIRELAGTQEVVIPVSAPGAQETLNTLQQLKQTLATMELSTPGLQIDNISELNNLLDGAARKAQTAREELREGIASGVGGEDLSNLKKADSAAQSYVDTLHRMTTATKTEINSSLKFGMSLDQQSKTLAKNSLGFKKLAEAARTAGEFNKAESYLNTAKAIDAQRATVDGLNKDLTSTGQVAKTSGQIMQDNFAGAGVTSLDQFSAKAKEIKVDLDAQKEAMLASGEAFRGGLDPILDQQAALQGLTNKMVGTEQGFRLLGKQVTGFQGIMKKMMESSFNQLGFVMFITLNTIKSLITAVKALAQVFIDGADSAALYRSAMITTGDSMQNLNQALAENSQGMLNVKTASSEAIFFINRMGEEYSGTVDSVAALTTSIGILGGATSEQQTEGFNKILSSIMGLNGGIVRIGNSYVDLDRAQALVNLRLAEGDELLRSDKIKIYVDEIERQKQAAEDATEGMRPLNNITGELSQSIGSAFDTIKIFAGGLLSTLFVPIKEVAKAIGSLISGVEKTGKGINNLLKIFLMINPLTSPFAVLAEIFHDGLAPGLVKVVNLLQLFLTIIPGGINAAVSGIKELQQSFVDLASVVDSAGAVIDALLDFDFTRAKAAFGDLKEVVKSEMADVGAAVVDGWDVIQDRADNLFDPLRSALGDLNSDMGKTLISPPKFDLSGMLDGLDAILGEEFSLQQDRQKVWEAYNEDLAQIEKDLTNELKELQETRHEDLLEAAEEFAKDRIEAQEDLTDKILDINGKLQLKEFRTQEDAEDSRRKAREKNDKKLEDIEESHQKKMNDIMRRFDLARLKALIDRDARALFEAERRRDEDLRKEREAQAKKKDDAKDTLSDTLREIGIAEAKKLERMREDAEINRKKAIADYKEKLIDLEDALAEETAAIEEAFADRQSKMKREAGIEKQQRKKDWGEQVRELLDQFAERERMEAGARLAARGAELQDMADRGELTRSQYLEWITDLTAYQVEHNKIVAAFNYPDPVNLGNYFGGGGGGADPPPPPGGNGGSDNGCVPGHNITYNPNLGDPCSQVASTMTVTACNGSKWQCYNGTWIPAGTVQADTQQVGALSTGTNQGGDSPWYGVGGAPQQAQITLVTNDAKLDAILNEVVYDAYIDIMT